MNVGFWMCIILAPIFAIIALIFGVMKEKAAMLISGFNTLPKKERDLYDKAYMVRDMRNSLIVWTLIMLAGAILSYFVSTYIAIVAYVIWLVLLFKDVHWDAHKAFEKYLLKKN